MTKLQLRKNKAIVAHPVRATLRTVATKIHKYLIDHDQALACIIPVSCRQGEENKGNAKDVFFEAHAVMSVSDDFAGPSDKLTRDIKVEVLAKAVENILQSFYL